MDQIAPAVVALIIVGIITVASRRPIRIAGAELAERINAVN